MREGRHREVRAQTYSILVFVAPSLVHMYENSVTAWRKTFLHWEQILSFGLADGHQILAESHVP